LENVSAKEHSVYERAAYLGAKLLKRERSIADCWRTKPSKFYDAQGVDLVIILLSGLAAFVQVKTGAGNRIYTSESDPSHGRFTKHKKDHENIKILIMIPRGLLRQPPPNLYRLIAEELRKAINKAIRETKEI